MLENRKVFGQKERKMKKKYICRGRKIDRQNRKKDRQNKTKDDFEERKRINRIKEKLIESKIGRKKD